MSVTYEQLPLEWGAPTVVRLPATAMVRYYLVNDESGTGDDADDVEPMGPWVALNLEALIEAHPMEWAGGEAGSLRRRLSDLVLLAVDGSESSGEPFSEWVGAVAWSGHPTPLAGCDVQVDAVAERKAQAHLLARV